MNDSRPTKGYALQIAEKLAGLGYKLVPIAPGQKYPKGLGRWQDEATDHLAKIKQWFALTDNGVGWAMGAQPNGTFTFAVDVDGEQGWESLFALIKEHGGDPEPFMHTACQTTGSGGGHFIFTSDVPIANSQKQLAEKIDIRGEGGQIVVGPTIHPNGNPYVWTKMPDDQIPLPAPEWLVELILSEPEPVAELPKVAAPTRSTTSVVGADVSPADWVRANCRIADMLYESGWTYMETKGDDTYWCRPGKNPRDGHSAILHGAAPLVVWSTEVPWRTGSDNRDGSMSFSPMQVYAEIHFGGDISEASKVIRREFMPSNDDFDPLASLPVANRPGHGLASDALTDDATGSEMVTASLAPLNLPDEFWETRPWLEQVRQAAWSRIMSPDAVLGALLSRYAAVVPVPYVVPAMIGYRGTFDHLSVLVGRSSAGKTAAGGIAEELFPDRFEKTIVWDYPAPSGEGLIDAFFEMVDEENPDTGKKERKKKQTKHAVHFTIDEAMSLISQTQRSGTTIASVILSAWSGSTIGQGNASDDRKRVIRKGKARVSGLMGIQEGLGHMFLTESLVRQGLAGRLVFFAAEDPNMPALDELPNFPNQLDLAVHPIVPTMLNYPDEIANEVRAAQYNKVTGHTTVADIDGHINLARVKLAGMFALIDGRTTVNLTDWELATHIMTVSTNIRKRMAALGQQSREKAQRDAGHMAAIKEVAKDEGERRLLINEAAIAIRKVLIDQSPLKKKPLKQALSSRFRPSDIINTALAELVDIRAIEEGPNGWSLK